jgi:HPt (histidine-containing phosphotransfer) domain-containing protein
MLPELTPPADDYTANLRVAQYAMLSAQAAEELVLPVDMVRLHEALGDEPDELFEILDLYLSQMVQSLAELEQAISAGNAAAVNMIAHNCAGTSANCGMMAVVESLRGLEAAGREGGLDNAPSLLSEAKSQFERIELFLKTELPATGTGNRQRSRDLASAGTDGRDRSGPDA